MNALLITIRLLKIAILTIIVVSFQNCAPNHKESEESLQLSLRNKLNYKYVNEAIIIPKCLSCHDSSGVITDIDFSTYIAITSGDYVVQYNANASQFFSTMKNQTMPNVGEKATTLELQVIKAWIDAGAPEFEQAVEIIDDPSLDGKNPADNIAPTVVITDADKTVSASVMEVTINADIDDPDSPESLRTVVWTKISGPSVSMAGVSSNILLISDLKVGVYEFELKVTDEFGEMDSDTIKVTVN